MAPTPTSDRQCGLQAAPCVPGQYEQTTASPTSLRVCETCQPGWTDLDGNVGTPCVKCDAGTYTPNGTVGACPICVPGTTDQDQGKVISLFPLHRFP